jgi:putative ATPase
MQRKAIVYDGTGDEHYDVISAFIKSMRGSDPDAAVYWLARMLESGENPMFIARRIAILASEDIGNADPQAIQVAAAAYTITERIGLPECQLTLAQAAIYMCCAPKSKAGANAIWSAAKDVREGRTIPVPRPLRDAHYAGADALEHGTGYIDPHQQPGGCADQASKGDPPRQEYLGVERVFYLPTDRGREADFREYLKNMKADQQSCRVRPKE